MESTNTWLREAVCSVFLYFTLVLVRSSQNLEVSLCYPVSIRLISCIFHNLTRSNHERHLSQLGQVKSCGLRIFLKTTENRWFPTVVGIFVIVQFPLIPTPQGTQCSYNYYLMQSGLGVGKGGIITSTVWDKNSVRVSSLHKHTQEPSRPWCPDFGSYLSTCPLVLS